MYFQITYKGTWSTIKTRTLTSSYPLLSRRGPRPIYILTRGKTDNLDGNHAALANGIAAVTAVCLSRFLCHYIALELVHRYVKFNVRLCGNGKRDFGLFV